jgi:hypothetical protein
MTAFESMVFSWFGIKQLPNLTLETAKSHSLEINKETKNNCTMEARMEKL